MNIEYIIVQAGGKGTRLEHLTSNKPKALLPVFNLPMIFHLFKQFPDKKFIIIGDYKKEVLRKYLSAFAKVKYLLVDAKDATGTCAGIRASLQKIPSGKPFMLIWSDLILPESFSLPEKADNYVGISKDFQCRWSYINDSFDETPSYEHGVAGLFVFQEKGQILEVEESGEFVRWLQTKGFQYEELDLSGTKEFGILEEYNKLEIERCRPFNKMTIFDDKIVKEGIDKQGLMLAVREKKWYQVVKEKGFSHVPHIYELEPLTMEKINGKNIYEYDKIPYEEKKEILSKIVSYLKELHNLDNGEVDYFSMKENYYTKTIDRLKAVRDLIPFADKESIIINGKKCRNVFFYQKELEERLDNLKTDHFHIIHGDCTFSNMILREDKEPVFIDPRGYFGFTEMLGDNAYDWAKLYYSIKGNYDRFNLKMFHLAIDDDGIQLNIDSNGWESLEDYYFELIAEDVNKKDIQLIHAVIWLSLTTYAWQDYDSICGAFYNGLYYLEESYGEIF